MNLAFDNSEIALSEATEFNRLANPWSDTDKKILSDLVADGFSARQIASVFEGRHTRNAVIGKCQRMGLQLTGSNKNCSPEEARLRHIERERKRRERERLLCQTIERKRQERLQHDAKPTPSIPTNEPAPYRLTLQQLKQDECRFPYGDSSYTFCGHKKMEGSSYCPFHHGIVYRRPE